jgi:hypothetical protein
MWRASQTIMSLRAVQLRKWPASYQRSLHANRSRRQFTAAAWSLCARLLGVAS